MVDTNPTDHTAHSTSPAAPLSADEIAEMRALLTRWRSIAADDTARVSVSAHQLLSSDMPRLLSALEALTAENARLTKKVDYWRRAHSAVAAEFFQNLADFGQRHQPETYATADHGWYARHRAAVEAAHAAAKQAQAAQWVTDLAAAVKDDEAEGLRPLTPDEIASHSYLLSRADKQDGGIDMALLGKLCREEPDEATKQAVAAMMDGIRAPNDSPLSDPEYPALMEEALRQVKDGD